MANFCPECGTPTIRKIVGGQERDACPNCVFVEFAQTVVGVGALVFREETVLLVERRSPQMWTIPSGYIEQGERLPQAVEREVLEETGLRVQAQGLVLVRNMDERAKNDLYCVFLCQVDATQQPQADQDEATNARFVHPTEFDTLNLEFFSRWLVETYLQQMPIPLPLLDIPGYEDGGAVVYANFTL